MRDRPNLLFIFTDQQNANMMSCAGNRYLRTPHMDSLAETGVRFTNCNCTYPLCMPSRFSLMTGRMPSEVGIIGNDVPTSRPPRHIIARSLGHLLRDAGYETAYGGKEHLPQISAVDIGFNYLCADERDELAESAAAFINRPRDKPFCLVASFINPHDICYQVMLDFPREIDRSLEASGRPEVLALQKACAKPPDVSDEVFFDALCPPLPDNFEIQPDEPEIIDWLLKRSQFRIAARNRYNQRDWRKFVYAYHRLTEMVDAQIGRLLDALRSSAQVQNTIVIFSSDHGEQAASHRLERKNVLYRESCEVPLIVSGPGVSQPGRTCDALVSNGLDLLPTLCDYAGTPWPDDLAGRSFRPLVECVDAQPTHRFLPIECEIGRSIVTRRYRYSVYNRGDRRRQLFDIENDPGEMRNLADDPAWARVESEHRELFAKHFGAATD